jgi:hypothetical protein
MTVDPNGCTFWYTTEYLISTGTNWQTRIGSFTMPGCGGGPLPTPTNTPPPSPTNTPVPTNTPPASTATPVPGGVMHVGDLDGSATSGSGRWNANVTITVHDANHIPVSNATVSGSWSNGSSGSSSCVTNGAGQCAVSKNSLKNNVSSVTFTVTNVTASGKTYSSAANHDPDGDSTGTTITILKP